MSSVDLSRKADVAHLEVRVVLGVDPRLPLCAQLPDPVAAAAATTPLVFAPFRRRAGPEQTLQLVVDGAQALEPLDAGGLDRGAQLALGVGRDVPGIMHRNDVPHATRGQLLDDEA